MKVLPRHATRRTDMPWQVGSRDPKPGVAQLEAFAQQPLHQTLFVYSTRHPHHVFQTSRSGMLELMTSAIAAIDKPPLPGSPQQCLRRRPEPIYRRAQYVFEHLQRAG